MKNLMLMLLLGVVPLSLNAQTTPPTKPPVMQTTPAEQVAARAEMADLQKQLGELSRRMADVSKKIVPQVTAVRYQASPSKGVVGVLLGISDLGIRVGGVTPDGPAAQAGIKSGDIITRVDDKDVGNGDAIKGAEQVRLMLGGLNDGDKVEIGYSREGKPATASVTATRREALNNYRVLVDGGPVDVETSEGADGKLSITTTHISDGAAEGVENEALKERVLQTMRERAISDAGRSRVEIRRLTGGTPWWGINLAELNPELGRYFGTDRGVLVLSTDGDALAGVKAGDVIQQVAGSEVSRPEDALRRLRDQPVESEVVMQLLRERKPITLNIRVPDNKSLFEMMPPPPAPPAPIAPGAPASPPPPPAVPAPAAGPASTKTIAKTAAKTAPTIDNDTPATIAAVTANPALLARVISPGAAAKGGAVGSPGLWGGRIRAVDTNDEGTCYIVAAATLDRNGKPVRGDFRNDTFSACTVKPLDNTQFVAGRYATFLGTVTGPARARFGRAGRPTMTVTDAKAWSKIADLPGAPRPARQGPPPNY